MKTSLIHWSVPAGTVGAKLDEHAGHETSDASHLKKSFMARLGVWLDRVAPNGYEDEEGFHYGDPTPPHHQENNWPI